MKYKSPYLIGIKEIMNSNKKIDQKIIYLIVNRIFPRSGSEKI